VQDSYTLLVCRQHRRPTIIHMAELRSSTPATYNLHATHLPPLPLAAFVRATHMLSTSSTCDRTRYRTSLLPTAVLYSYVPLICCQRCRPAFVHIAEPRWYTQLSYSCMCCSDAVNSADLHLYTLQNLLATHGCRTFVNATRLASTSSTCVRMHCRTSLVRTTVLQSYALYRCHQHR